MNGETKTIKCSGNKSDGSRCTREKQVAIDFAGEWYCWQHQNKAQNVTDTTNEELSENQLKAIDLLISGEFTKTEIAEKCDISRRQLYRWLEDEIFKKIYYERLDEIKDKFNPKLLNMINDIMRTAHPEEIDDELDKIEALERLFKLYQLLNGEATDIIKGDFKHQGDMNYNIDLSYMSDEELKKELEKFKE
ncbi:putative insertion element HTH domain-containing protein [Orenia metallireducens]|uniref:Helix-turn-helix of insertion element transposase n=1 Tax=Orenia metallireducens TaxID=1413210 RepID=A0A285I9T6_9FIRM|nr:phBC6A51 family helix-turn-helix protein [Orenia metallireducens]PRX21708.1 putative insertion element HTH domain-containing protein [Orenia metallireducens]SNY44567.1 Helix-turn-helix of insertion element transposase [Orenia metallireducens]